MEKLNKEDVVRQTRGNPHYFIWQSETYGKPYFIAENPAEIFKYRTMPNTPAGDFVGTASTIYEAIEIIQRITEEKIKDPEKAKEFIEAYHASKATD